MTWSVLVVDDNTLVRQVLGTLIDLSDDLVLAGAAEGGDDALQFARDARVDAVICDIQMPGVTGLELIPQLLPMRPELVVVTYSSETLDPATAHRLGIARTFDKASNPIELLELIANLCTHRCTGRTTHLPPQENPT